MSEVTDAPATYTPDEVAQHRAELVAALRSDRFTQDRGRLRTLDGYCCLGVAEELRGCVWKQREGHGNETYAVMIDEDSLFFENNYLTVEAMAYYGFVVRNPFVFADGEVTPLATLNDRGFTFELIAAIIEAQLAAWDGSELECRNRWLKSRENS